VPVRARHPAAARRAASNIGTPSGLALAYDAALILLVFALVITIPGRVIVAVSLSKQEVNY